MNPMSDYFYARPIPNAAIIFDRFHIVQHLNRELNKYRVQVMNEYRNKKGPNYTIFKNNWKVLLMDTSKTIFSKYRWNKSFKAYKRSSDIVRTHAFKRRYTTTLLRTCPKD